MIKEGPGLQKVRVISKSTKHKLGPFRHRHLNTSDLSFWFLFYPTELGPMLGIFSFFMKKWCKNNLLLPEKLCQYPCHVMYVSSWCCSYKSWFYTFGNQCSQNRTGTVNQPNR
ncbi:hypothetical protein AMTRI_Chr08g162550 [Amborella trichopoda]